MQQDKHDSYVRDLESYIDNLLVRVMECTPRLLQNPFSKANRNRTNNTALLMKVEDIPPQGNLANPVFIPTSSYTQQPN